MAAILKKLSWLVDFRVRFNVRVCHAQFTRSDKRQHCLSRPWISEKLS